MIEFEIGLLVAVFWILFGALMVVNYKAFKRYPDRLRELMLGDSIRQRKGPGWFVITKLVIALALFSVFLTLGSFLPTRYSYLILGIFIGVAYFNLLNDIMKYKQVAESEQRR